MLPKLPEVQSQRLRDQDVTYQGQIALCVVDHFGLSRVSLEAPPSDQRHVSPFKFSSVIGS